MRARRPDVPGSTASPGKKWFTGEPDVRGALVGELAVAPGNVDRPGPVDLGRRKGRRSHADQVTLLERGNPDGVREARSAVDRAHRRDLVREHRDGSEDREDDDEVAIRANNRLDAVDDGRRPPHADADRSGPGATAVARASGLDEVVSDIQIGEVAAPAEAASRPVVADEPLLVVLLGRAARPR